MYSSNQNHPEILALSNDGRFSCDVELICDSTPVRFYLLINLNNTWERTFYQNFQPLLIFFKKIIIYYRASFLIAIMVSQCERIIPINSLHNLKKKL